MATIQTHDCYSVVYLFQFIVRWFEFLSSLFNLLHYLDGVGLAAEMAFSLINPFPLAGCIHNHVPGSIKGTWIDSFSHWTSVSTFRYHYGHSVRSCLLSGRKVSVLHKQSHGCIRAGMLLSSEFDLCWHQLGSKGRNSWELQHETWAEWFRRLLLSKTRVFFLSHVNCKLHCVSWWKGIYNRYTHIAYVILNNDILKLQFK